MADGILFAIYNCEIIPQLNEVRLESASLDELNFLAKRLISLNEDERNIIKGIATKVIPTDEDEIVSIRDLINMTYGTGIVSVVSNVTNDEQLGEFVIENELQDEIALVPEGATHLLDKEKIGRIQRAADGGVYVGNLYVCADHFEMPKVYDGITLPEVEPEPWFAFRLLVAEPPQGDEPNVEAAEWITLPMTLKEMREFATRHHVDSITDCVYYDSIAGFEQKARGVFGVVRRGEVTFAEACEKPKLKHKTSPGLYADSFIKFSFFLRYSV